METHRFILPRHLVAYWCPSSISSCGAHVQGSANGYPIDALVVGSGHKVVVAATNYRLGPFGFLGSTDIQGRTSDGSAGNFGIQDQQLAMTWVRDHIAAFGGDGSDVTIFGESAGGKSTINHLAAPASGGLFKKAIIESGAYDYGADSLDVAEEKYQKIKLAVDCKDLDCLLAVDAKKLIEAFHGGIGPVVDGIWLKEAPWDSIANGRYHKEVPVMLGGNRDEVSLFLFLDRTPADMTEVQFDEKLKDRGLSSEEIKLAKTIYDLAVYPFPKDLGKYSIWWWTYMRAATDTVPGLGPCSARRVARHLVKGGSPAVYAYLFARGIWEIKSLVHGMTPHAGEIPFVMGDANLFLDKKEKDLARAASALWSSFAINGAPAADGLPEWPQYNADDDAYHALRRRPLRRRHPHSAGPPQRRLRLLGCAPGTPGGERLRRTAGQSWRRARLILHRGEAT